MIEDGNIEETPLSIIMIDMDYFGQINKKYGHQSGDAVLKELGRRIKQSMWPTDICARYGGEEFIIITHNTDIDEVTRVAKRLLDIICSTPFIIPAEPKSITCTASIGVAMLQYGESTEELIARADAALKKLSRKGGIK